MAEEDKNTTPEEEYDDDGNKNPNYVAPKAEGEDAADIENKGKEEEDELDFDDSIDPNKPPEIPLRKDTAQYIIARKNKKIEKLQSKLKEGDEGYVPPEKDEEEDDSGEDDKGEEMGAIAEKIFEKKMAPLLGKIASDAEEAEFQELVKADPEAAKYTNHIKAYMKHPAYKGVPPTVIYHHLAFEAAQAIGARKKKAADLEAAQGKGGGRQAPANEKIDGLPSAEDI
jgi:hypothetical protein